VVCGNDSRSRYRTLDRTRNSRPSRSATVTQRRRPERPPHVLIVGCGIAGLVAAISLRNGIPGHDCRGGDGILSCKPSQNVLPSLPLHAMMPVIRSTRYLTRVANRSEQASASPPTLCASSVTSTSRKSWNNIPGRDLSARGGGLRWLSEDTLIGAKWRMAEM
jgi:hypothetical protein